METYFIDWEIMDENGTLYKWGNTLVESNAKPKDVFEEAKNDIINELEIDTGSNTIRARCFNKL